MIVQQRTQFWLILLLFFFPIWVTLKWSHPITTLLSLNGTYGFWIINTVQREQVTVSTIAHKRISDDTEWEGNLRWLYSISRIMCPIRLKRQCVSLKAAFDRSNRCSIYCTWSSIKYRRIVCDRKNTRGNLQSWLQIFVSKKKKKKLRKAKREYNANFLRQQNLADTDSQVISASNFKRHC